MSAFLFATEVYALPILRPLAAAATARGIATAWVVPEHVATRLHPDEQRLTRLSEVRRWSPRTVFCAANWVPVFPGNKVQVFHGFNAEKRPTRRGHFRLRGFFDLYCTQGPATTRPFRQLAVRHRYFAVEETGWPKLDPLFGPPSATVKALRAAARQRPIVLYAATFTESLSAARAMLAPLSRWIARGDRYWLLTLHPKCDDALKARYQALAAQYPQHAMFGPSEQLIDMLRAADVLVCDTSSVIDEFALQLKPVVTVCNRRPKPFMLNVTTPQAVAAALEVALQHPPALMHALKQHAEAIHPWRDGRSSERVLDAAARLAEGGYAPLARKPRNLWRRWQARRKLELMLS
jgi:CDP-glycerol glycerophosphotransferase (TagB/SpsB family)